jgi:ribosome-associated protein
VPQYKPSKSEKKREVLALQALGEQLIELTEAQLRDMELPENLFDAVTAASGIKSRGALRRQCQLIGKLMRNVDPEPIRRAIENLQRQERADKAIFKRAEHWRNRIVEGRHGGLNEFFEVTGSSSGDLSSMLDEYLAVPQESGRRALRKRIFRQVHEELTKATIGR